jgi:hypothetical protein
MRIRSSRRRRSPCSARPFLRERRVPPGAWDALSGKSAPAAARDPFPLSYRRPSSVTHGMPVVPHHHPAGAVGRAGSAQRRRAGGAEAQDTVARRHHAPGDESARGHAAAGRQGDRRAPFGHPCRGRGCISSGSTACWPRTPGCGRGWCHKGMAPMWPRWQGRPARLPPPPEARPRRFRPGRTGSAKHGCSSGSLTSTCSTARTAVSGN